MPSSKQTQEKPAQSNGEVALNGPRYNSDDLVSIESFDDALKLVVKELGAVPVAADQVLGDGFAIVDNKDTLCGVPLLFLTWSFHAGDFGEFVSAHVVARNDGGGARKAILNDGGSGVYKQLVDYSNKTNKMGGLIARHGLRRSDYTFDDGTGEKPAKTYYIDTSA